MWVTYYCIDGEHLVSLSESIMICDISYMYVPGMED